MPGECALLAVIGCDEREIDRVGAAVRSRRIGCDGCEIDRVGVAVRPRMRSSVGGGETAKVIASASGCGIDLEMGNVDEVLCGCQKVHMYPHDPDKAAESCRRRRAAVVPVVILTSIVSRALVDVGVEVCWTLILTSISTLTLTLSDGEAASCRSSAPCGHLYL